MKSSNVSYDCRIDASPRVMDHAMSLIAACAAVLGVAASGLPWIIKSVMGLILVALCLHRLRCQRGQGIEWQIGRVHLIRVRRRDGVTALPEFFEESEVECIGPWVCLRGRVEGRLQYGMMWPWHLDSEQYRRIRRLASLRHAGPAVEASP